MSDTGSEHEQLKRRAKEAYSSIKHIPCPVFDNEPIYFTNEGFNHLVRKGRIPRTVEDQLERFCLIPHILPILSDPKPLVVYKYKEAQDGRPSAEFWTFIKKINGLRVKVVVRKLGNSTRKHFFSVMIKNKKPLE